jgi:hypothetical protein
MPKKKKSKAQGLSPQQIQQMNRDNINYQMSVLPPLEFDDMYENSQQMMGGLMGNALPLFGAIMGRGEQTMANNPMMPLFEMLGISAGGQPSEPLPPPQLSAYDLRIQELMDNRGWSREQAVANQASALKNGRDYNNDGAISNDEWARHLGADYDNSGGVTNQEWAKYKAAQAQPVAAPPQQPVAGGTTPGVPSTGYPNLTPEQAAALQKFQGYRGGMR